MSHVWHWSVTRVWHQLSHVWQFSVYCKLSHFGKHWTVTVQCQTCDIELSHVWQFNCNMCDSSVSHTCDTEMSQVWQFSVYRSVTVHSIHTELSDMWQLMSHTCDTSMSHVWSSFLFAYTSTDTARNMSWEIVSKSPTFKILDPPLTSAVIVILPILCYPVLSCTRHFDSALCIFCGCLWLGQLPASPDPWPGFFQTDSIPSVHQQSESTLSRLLLHVCVFYPFCIFPFLPSMLHTAVFQSLYVADRLLWVFDVWNAQFCDDVK